LRASFPPGSVTGAPKIRTMRVIAELEATGREAYTGAIGYASPVAGLELNVAIRTLETRGERIWLGAGGGIVADSHPEGELEECLVKARPVVEAAGGRLAGGVGIPSARMRHQMYPPPFAGGGASGGGAVPEPLFALDGSASRPDPDLGVFTTMLVRDGTPVDLREHLKRLGASVLELYGQELADDLERRVRATAEPHRGARLRIVAGPGTAPEVEVHPLGGRPRAEPVPVAPVALPGGLGAHKWRDRRLLDELERRLGAVALIVDLDGEVLEAAHANVWILEGRRLLTPPLDGRLLPGTARAALLADPPPGMEAGEEPIPLERAAAADELWLTSSLRGVHPAALGGRGATPSPSAVLAPAS
jgi:para-aminobenzoate synthetase/4-amino-4-deoxychorismate lyase